ncbi:MAG: IS1634 family transposase [Leptolyngbyaceae cyanobacterium SM1_4_3]|nr:IS1634 family transposase [Leptolyngbyaceae cyanobacterium SM1_4_3]
MNPSAQITTERVDDIPLLLAQMERMGVQALLDEHFPQHGNWQGMSMGRVAVVWLSHILSQADHRLNQVQAWVEHHIETIGESLGQEVRGLDWSDDRLEGTLRYLSDDEDWRQFEAALTQRQIQVYDLRRERVRLDSTSVSGFWSASEDGLFQRGHSKDHRPDLCQLKLMLASLDPLGLPIASEIVAGNAADDPLYAPAVQQVRQTLNTNGLLFVGDCKMGSLSTRYLIASGGDYYLCPLSKTQVNEAQMQDYLSLVVSQQVELESIDYDYANGKTAEIAKGYEQEHECHIEIDGENRTWMERRLIVYSIAQGNAQKQALQIRIAQAQSELAALNQPGRGKKPWSDLASLTQATERVMAKHRVTGLFALNYCEQVTPVTQRKYRDRPAQVVEQRRFQVDFTLALSAVEQQMQQFGWRVYATNHPQAQLSLSQAVGVYRQEYLIEHQFGRLKGHPLSLKPMFLQREDHIKGLMRLLSIGLQLLTLVEFQVRRALAQQQAELAGLYAGNPKRSTAQPTAERLLASFKEITLVLIHVKGEVYADLTPLNPLQQRVLQLMNFPTEIYTRLGTQSDDPP